MLVFVYDKTFEGLMSAVFESFDIKLVPDLLVDTQQQHSYLFTTVHVITTDEQRADRVWLGLKKKLSYKYCQMLYHVFLSELPEVDMLVFRYMRKVFESNHNIEREVGDPVVIDVMKIGQKVSREAQRLSMFVRFQKTADDIYFAAYDPQFNVLPLMITHFKNRFSDQQWLIYDTRRKFGFFYNLKTVQEIKLDDEQFSVTTGKVNQDALAADEQQFQELWKLYFKSMTIKERINPKLHAQLLPRRFWKYLTEKQI